MLFWVFRNTNKERGLKKLPSLFYRKQSELIQSRKKIDSQG